jgi:23S rRNA pseudouridine1911/1915/1917 synthase
MQEYRISVTEENAHKRLDAFLIEFSNENNLGFSRTFLQSLIKDGAVFSGGTAMTKPNFKVKPGQEIAFSIPEKKIQGLEAENIPLKIVYEDDDLAIIDKPAGLVVHPAPGNYEHTLVNALMHRFKKLSDINPERPGIVHRLDKETSGIIVVAKNNPAHLNLVKQFADHSIKRIYVALVKGKVEYNENVIEMPIGRHPLKRESMSVGFTKSTRYAKTHYRTLKRAPLWSLVELTPFTGRTHQLRVHLAYIGHPILGDSKYGKQNAFVRMALHARYLGFIHPSSKEFVEFESPMPKEFSEFIKKSCILPK